MNKKNFKLPKSKFKRSSYELAIEEGKRMSDQNKSYTEIRETLDEKYPSEQFYMQDIMASILQYAIKNKMKDKNMFKKMEDGGNIESYPQISKNYQLEADYKIGQNFEIDVIGGRQLARIKSMSFEVIKQDGKEIIEENSYRIEYLNTSNQQISESHFSFLKHLKKEKNTINISVPYSIGSGIFFENSIYDHNIKLLNGIVNSFKVLYYGTRIGWFDYFIKSNEKNHSVDSKDAYNSVENYIEKVSSNIKNELPKFKEPTSKRFIINLEYKVGQKIKIPVYGGFQDGVITKMDILLGVDWKKSYYSKIHVKYIDSNNNNDFEYSYMDFEKEIRAEKIPNEISVEYKALESESVLVLIRYMGGSKLKIEKCNGHVLELTEKNQSLKYITTELQKEIFTSMKDFKSKITSKYYNVNSVYEDGGGVPNTENSFKLPLEIAVYVPSTKNVNEVISVDEMNERENQVKTFLAERFGGYTMSDKLGGYVDNSGNLVNEEITQVVSFATIEAWEKYKNELVAKISEWADKWGQEAIGLEFEGDMFYIEKEPAMVMKNGGQLWIQNAVDKMKQKGTIGAFTKQAKREGLSTTEFAKKVLDKPEKYTLKTKRRAIFFKNTNPEKF